MGKCVPAGHNLQAWGQLSHTGVPALQGTLYLHTQFVERSITAFSQVEYSIMLASWCRCCALASTKNAPSVGLEPTTIRLRVVCSTN